MTIDPELLGSEPHSPPPASANGAPDPSGIPGWRLLLRGLLGRCPVCGGRKLFPTFLKMVPKCSTCGYNFERESGWWLGAMTMNVGAALVLYMAFLVGALLLTYPDVPWGALTAGGVALMVVFPILFAPVSRTLWIALDVLFNRMG